MYLFSSRKLPGVSQTSCARLVKVVIIRLCVKSGYRMMIRQVICWFSVHCRSQFVVAAYQTVLFL